MQIGKLKINYNYNDKKYDDLHDMLSEMSQEDLNDFYAKATRAVKNCEEKLNNYNKETIIPKSVVVVGMGLMFYSPLAGGVLKSLGLFALGFCTSLVGYRLYRRKNVKKLANKLKLINFKYMEREASKEITERLEGKTQSALCPSANNEKDLI